MDKEYTLRRATIGDKNFLVKAIINAEKSGTDKFGLAGLLELPEEQIALFLSNILEEELEGSEFCPNNFIVACYNNKPVSTFCGWIEGYNEDSMPSSVLKSNLFSYFLPKENIALMRNKIKNMTDFHIDRDLGTYQLEYAYTEQEHRGKGLLNAIINTHISDYLQFTPPYDNFKKSVQVQLVENNSDALKLYSRNGFTVKKRIESDSDIIKRLFPGCVKLLMERTL